MTRWTMVVIQQPYLHSPFLRFGEDDVHIPPPALSRKVGMGTGLHAKGAASAVVDGLNLFGDLVGVIAVLPIEGEQVVALLSVQDLL